MRAKYPMGVKVSQRAFSQDKVVLLRRCLKLLVVLNFIFVLYYCIAFLILRLILFMYRLRTCGASTRDRHVSQALKNIETEVVSALEDDGGFPGILWDPDADDDDIDEGLNVGYKAVPYITECYERQHTVLTGFPTGTLDPQPFIEGARVKIEKVAIVC
jgi:hypothetical protein